MTRSQRLLDGRMVAALRFIGGWFLMDARYCYLATRFLVRIPLYLLPIPARFRNRVAGALIVGLWFLSVYFNVAYMGSPWWVLLLVGVAAVLAITWIVWLEGRRARTRRRSGRDFSPCVGSTRGWPWEGGVVAGRGRTKAERFWEKVVKGPRSQDCWAWVGAIADDGYGRFWIPRDGGGQRAVRPQRYAYEQLTGKDPALRYHAHARLQRAPVVGRESQSAAS